MIRRDYLLRMLAEFAAVLSRIRSLQKDQRWKEAHELTAQEFQRLIGASPEELLQLSETEVLAKLIRAESTLAVREKALLVTTLLKEAGDTAGGSGKQNESIAYYLKGLNLLLGVLAREDVSDYPEFVPRVETFVRALADTDLPMESRALLMQYYERIGAFGQAEDMLFSIIDQQPHNPATLDFGAAFYRRLAAQSDDALMAGNLPRAEVQAGLAQLQSRKAEAGRPAS